jgi:hypothetical protein
VFSLTVNIGLSGGSGEDGENSVAGAGGAAVLVLLTDTRAYAGRDPEVAAVDQPAGNVSLRSAGSTAITAESRSDADVSAGSLAVTGDSTGIGASVSVIVDIDKTHAFIGEDADVTALGGGDAVDVWTGEVDGSGNRINESVRGLAVTANSTEDQLLIAIGAGGAVGDDAVGVGLSVPISLTASASTLSTPVPMPIRACCCARLTEQTSFPPQAGPRSRPRRASAAPSPCRSSRTT